LSEIITPIVYQLGIGGVGGFIVGFALKKLAKLFIVIIGIFVLALLYLGINNVISINYDALWTAIANALGIAGQAASWIAGVISLLPFVGSLAFGFILGFKVG
jgi:uncharacterized membrane protein (Fun14 family)